MIIINEHLCKRCEICVHFCPQHVYVMDRIPKIVRENKCTKCKFCELICPELAISIE